MLLVNGSIGIGTGFSTSVYQYSPVAIANYLMDKMKGGPVKELIPWYSGFQGKIEKIGANEYSCEGKYKALKGSKLIITELPIIGKERATYEYKNFLDTKLIEGPKDRDYKNRFIRDYKNYSTDNVVRFEIQFVKGVLEEKLLDKETFLKDMKLKRTFNCNNMHAFDSNGQIKHYDSADEIIEDFYDYRQGHYQRRLEYLLESLQKEIVRYSSQARFLEYVMKKKLIIFNRPEEDIIVDLEKNEFPKQADKKNSEGNYDYLLDISIRKMTKENYDKLKQKLDEVTNEHATLSTKTNLDLWKTDLDELIVEYKKMEKARNAIMQKDIKQFLK